MVPEIVKLISKQFNSLNQKEMNQTVKSEGPMCKAQDSSHMSHTYKTKVSTWYIIKLNQICMIFEALLLNLKHELNHKPKRPLGQA
jgi:hypothetical protein